MRVLGLTVGFNEADRYLEPMLAYMTRVVDDHFFYDDRSTDRTANIAYGAGCVTVVRPGYEPSFLEDEGAFRAGAWRRFEQSMHPRPGDWVIVIDCDEVLVSRRDLVRPDLDKVIEKASQTPAHGVMLNIVEIFGFHPTGIPLQRVDRLWGTIHAPRLFRYKPDAQFTFGPFGVPAVPTYVQAGPYVQTDEVQLLHFGYADEQDQHTKYARYRGGTGHSIPHVESILAEDKELVPLDWPYPEAMRR